MAKPGVGEIIFHRVLTIQTSIVSFPFFFNSSIMLKHIFKTGERPSEELHRLIEAKDWDAVMVRIETHSPELRKLATCPVLFDTFKRSSALPLTNALCNHAPLAVIVKLLDDYPKAIDCTDTAYDRMPLSLALLHCAPENVIMELLVRCPRAASLQDRLRRTALHYAIGNKHPMIVIDHLLELFPDAVEKRDHRGWLPLHVACARGAPITLVKNLCERDPSSIFIGDNNGLIPKDFIEHVAEGVRNDEVYDYLHRVTPTLSGFKFNFSGQVRSVGSLLFGYFQ